MQPFLSCRALAMLLGAALSQAADAVSPDPAWFAKAQQALAQREYHAGVTERGLQAPNREQGFRAYFDEHGLRLVDRAAEGELLATLQWTEVSRHGDRRSQEQAFGLPEVSNEAAIVTLTWPELRAEYDNRPDGLHQVVVLESRPFGDGALRLAVDVGAAKPRLGGDAVILRRGESELRMAAFVAHDALGRHLPANLTSNRHRLVLEIDDQLAAYPITVESSLTRASAATKSLRDGAADFQVEVDEPNANLGFSVAGAGDVNGDGYDDLIIGAPSYDGGHVDAGVAGVFFGGPGGDILDGEPDAVFNGGQVAARLGTSVAGLGDFNGDGYDDVIVGAPGFTLGQANEGAAFIYYGGPGDLTDVAHVLIGQQADAALGHSVAGAGDLNGDGYDDAVAGAPHYKSNLFFPESGAVFVLLGGESVPVEATPDSTLTVVQPQSRFGASVAGAGDVNGDGYADLVVGARLFTNGQAEEGAVFVYAGSADGVQENSVPVAVLELNQAGAQFGASVAGAGDFNGDGFADVIVGAPLRNNSQGTAVVYYGGGGAFGATPDVWFEGPHPGAWLGTSVAGAGDVNGDGYADLVVGAPFYSGGPDGAGAAFVVLGGADLDVDAIPEFHLEMDQPFAVHGWSVAGAGDVNGDGYADVIVGAPGWNGGDAEEGAAFVYLGAGDVIFADGFEP